jgi:DNA-binding ferritin-like protein
MSDWKAYLAKTSAPELGKVRKVFNAVKPVLGKGLSTVAEGGALGVGIGATEYVMNKKMQAMEKQLKAMEKEKSSSLSYENVFHRLMAYLRALYELHQWMHWRTKGQTFYGDHQLFQRMYEKAAEELDGMAEKAIGLSNNVNVIDPKGSANAAADVLEDFQFTPDGALAAEHGFISLLKDVRDNLGEGLTDGLDNFLQGLSDTHESHVYLLQQRVGAEEKTASDPNLIGVYHNNRIMYVPREEGMAVFDRNRPGIVERAGGRLGALTGGTVGGIGTALLARKAGLGNVGTALAGGAGALGGGSFGGLVGAGSAEMLRRSRGQRNLEELSKLEVPPPPVKSKVASLDRALGALYQKYGPPLEKHAAATFYGTLDKDRLDREALGAQFCKLASVSGMDPWKLATQVVVNYPKLTKLAHSSAQSRAGELAQFYTDWADGLLKRANLLDAPIRAARALKAGARAIVPKSSKSVMNQAVHAAESGAAIPEARKGVMGSMRDSWGHTKALQNAGGGNLRRGEALVKEDPSLLHAGVHSPATAPTVAPTPPVEESGHGDLTRGAMILGGLGLGGAAMFGGRDEPPQPNGMAQPGYGVAYA